MNPATNPASVQESFDLFDTAALRARVLDAWRAAPERFREDANAEEDLRIGGYADRLATELAANAADAAFQGGVPGDLRVSLVDTGEVTELRVANTGAALDTAGVSALASLRASAKSGTGRSAAGRAVGRFGVGFAAVLAVTDEPELRSGNGGVRFSLAGTRSELSAIAELESLLRARQGGAPILRLPWPAPGSVPPGFGTEVVLPLRDGVDGADLLAGFAAQAGDLLLALPGLRRIEVDGKRWQREELPGGVVAVHGPDGTDRWLLHRAEGRFNAEQLEGLGVEERAKDGFWTCWAVGIDGSGALLPATPDVLHAPTPTDERLSLPARLLATVPIEPTRRRVQHGPATDAVLAAAAAAYPGLLAAVPSEQRPKLVPQPGFPLSEVDEVLRDEVLDVLRGSPWLPAAAGGELAPVDAAVIEDAPGELIELLADVQPGLLAVEVSDAPTARALGTVGVRGLRLGAVAAALAGVHREPAWWSRLYAALAPMADVDPGAREELGELAVPLADGRTVTGPRSTLLATPDVAELMSSVDTSGIVGLRIVHPDATHPLLSRLGAGKVDALDLLDTPELADAVARSVTDAAAGADVLALAGLVLRLVELSGVDPGERSSLGALALPDQTGEIRRADELVLPDSALLDVLDENEVGQDGSLGLLDGEFAAEWPRSVLAGLGVLDGFSVLVDAAPAAPDHDLPDEQRWWADIGAEFEPPARLAGIRELDLVAEHAWPAALRMLAAEPATWQAISDPDGHPAWWLARYAVLADHPPRHWRMPDATELAGLYDGVPDVEVPERVLAAIGVRRELRADDAAEAIDLLARLADPAREVPVGVALRAHALLAAAVRDGLLDPSDVDPPGSVRTLSGASAPSQEVLVVDAPWLFGVLDASESVAVADLTDATALAELLDLPLASEEFTGEPAAPGEAVQWAELGAVAAAVDLLGIPVPSGAVLLHDELLVGGQRVYWWLTEDEVLHAEDSPEGLGRALAWTLGHWAQRHQLVALLGDPEAYLA